MSTQYPTKNRSVGWFTLQKLVDKSYGINKSVCTGFWHQRGVEGAVRAYQELAPNAGQIGPRITSELPTNRDLVLLRASRPELPISQIARLKLTTTTTLCPMWMAAGKQNKKALDIWITVIVNYNSIGRGSSLKLIDRK
jgi:hypothetical protein